ncbi:MAG: ATP-binding cassette domain-containing protein [Alcaligenaceae bacterium]|nr:ATP-binding cassette domain-containing protein [Alcaligenaceae bacterium]
MIALETQELTMNFGGVKALKAIDFKMKKNELRCLIGPNGAGKSTFFKIISGQQSPTSGKVYFNEQDITHLEAFERARLGIGIKNQIPSVMDGLSVYENLMLASQRQIGSDSPAKKIAAICSLLELSHLFDKQVGELAHGQRQWVEIGMMLVNEPELILFDEPAAGMSDEETREMAKIILKLTEKASVIVVEHDIRFLRLIAEKVTVFNQGEILFEGTFDEVVQNEEVRRVYLGRGTDKC